MQIVKDQAKSEGSEDLAQKAADLCGQCVAVCSLQTVQCTLTNELLSHCPTVCLSVVFVEPALRSN